MMQELKDSILSIIYGEFRYLPHIWNSGINHKEYNKFKIREGKPGLLQAGTFRAGRSAS